MAAVRVGATFGQQRPKFAIYSSIPFPLRLEKGAHGETRKLASQNEGNGAGYGISLTSPEIARRRYRSRRKMIDLKLKISDWSLYLALFGLLLAVIDAETVALYPRKKGIAEQSAFSFFISTALRVIIVISTLVLDVLIFLYHSAEMKISLIETGNDYWRVGITFERVLKLVFELIICSICPVPGIGSVEWPLLGRRPSGSVRIPLDVLLCLPMFLRLYIACRYLVLHSVQFQDPATKAMASLNQISVDFPFVVKTQLMERPLAIIAFTVGFFWLILAWMLTQCERYSADDISSNRHLIDFIWFEVVTFFSIGYGDVQVQTYCGRALAIITGIVGTLMSSLLIALVGRRMQLSLSEKRVNQVIAESQLSIQYKHSAARVLQYTWKTIKSRRISCQTEGNARRRALLKFRMEQRNLLKAIYGFRRARWRLRLRLEDEDDYIAFKRSFVETQDRLSVVKRRQQHLRMQLNLLTLNVQKLSSFINSSS